MKNNFLKFSMIALTASSLTFFGCSKEESKSGGTTGGDDGFPTTKKALFLYYTGSECNPCGSIGIPNYNTVISDLNMKDKVVPISVHCNAPAADKLFDAKAGQELLALIISNNSYSAPTYLIPPNAKFSGSASNSASLASSQISAIASQSAVASVKASVSVTDGVIYNVKTSTKFLTADSGSYKVSVLVMEDGVVFHQIANSKVVDPYTHNEVLRGRFSLSAFGDDIKTGKAASGEIVEKTFLGTVPADNPSNPQQNWNKKNLSAAVVVWKHTKSGSTTVVEVMNCTKITLPALQ
jgi:hypothetical protein